MVHSSLLPRAVWWRHQLLGSDHLPLFFELQVTPWALREDELKLKWNWREADWDAFRREVDQEVDAAVQRSCRWSLKCKVNFLEEAILGLARQNMGMVRVKGEGRSWVIPELRAATKRRNRLGTTSMLIGMSGSRPVGKYAGSFARPRLLPGGRTSTPWVRVRIPRGPGMSYAP